MPEEISEQETSLITSRTPLTALPVASLFFTHGERSGQEIPLARDTFFIGRSKNNNISFDDKSVSRKHAVINMLEGEYIISDLSSLKGTYVNGKKIAEVTLKPGDVINIGENRMQFRLITPSGRWVAPSKKGFFRYVWIAFLVIGLGIAGTWVYSIYFSGRIPDEVLEKIEASYDRGIKLYNEDRDVVGARDEWKKILELDPKMKTQFAIRAVKLLKNTEGGKPAE